MATEREIKLRIENLAAVKRTLRERKVRIVIPRTFERNVLFDTIDSRLAKSEQLLRIRTECPIRRHRKSRSLLTFKRPITKSPAATNGERHKVREEIEMEIPNEDILTKIFHGLELRAWFRYEKMRTTFRFPGTQRWAKGLLIEVDETPIGNFLELEGPASAIDRAAAALGFHKNDYVLANYMVLYREYCERRGDQPRDMLFANKKRAPRS